MIKVEQSEGSIQTAFNKTAESKDYLSEIFPFSGSMNKHLI